MKLTFVFPCLNEEETLPACIEEVKQALSDVTYDWEILVADNGSTDRSAGLAAAAGARVIPVSAKGYGAALTAGILAAKGEYAVFADADGSYPLTHTPELVKKADETHADMVIASRFTGTIEPGAMPFLHRYCGTPLLTGFINLLYHGHLTDCNSGFRLVRCESFRRWNMQCDGMEFASELLVKALKNKAVMSEVPGGLRPDKRSRAPHLKTWRDGMRHLLLILSEAPGLYEKTGLVLLIAGTLFQILALIFGLTKVGYFSIFDIHTRLVALILTILGMQFYLLGCFLGAASPQDNLTKLTRSLINMPADILFFVLAGLFLLLTAGLGTVAGIWIANGCSFLNLSGLLFFLTHLLVLVGFTGFGLLELHLLKKKLG